MLVATVEVFVEAEVPGRQPGVRSPRGEQRQQCPRPALAWLSVCPYSPRQARPLRIPGEQLFPPDPQPNRPLQEEWSDWLFWACGPRRRQRGPAWPRPGLSQSPSGPERPEHCRPHLAKAEKCKAARTCTGAGLASLSFVLYSLTDSVFASVG